MPKEIKIAYIVWGLLMLFALFNIPSPQATNEKVEVFTIFIIGLGLVGVFLTLFTFFVRDAAPVIKKPEETTEEK
jgi:hypothetical protein